MIQELNQEKEIWQIKAQSLQDKFLQEKESKSNYQDQATPRNFHLNQSYEELTKLIESVNSLGTPQQKSLALKLSNKIAEKFRDEINPRGQFNEGRVLSLLNNLIERDSKGEKISLFLKQLRNEYVS